MATVNLLIMPDVEAFECDCGCGDTYYRPRVIECHNDLETIIWKGTLAMCTKDAKKARLAADVRVDLISHQRRHQLHLEL